MKYYSKKESQDHGSKKIAGRQFLLSSESEELSMERERFCSAEDVKIS